MSRTRRKNNSIVGQFVAHPRELRESSAWLALPDNARRILDRLEIEHMRHGGAENGTLPCTYSDFVLHGLRGGRSISEFRNPSRYRLTYINGRGMSAIKSDEWRRITSADAATAALQRAAEEKNHATQAIRRMAKLKKAGRASVPGPGRAIGTKFGT